MTQIPSDQPEISTGGQEDYEARFKGLQRTFNSQAETLKAKDTALAQTTAQLQARADALAQAETNLAKLKSDLDARDQALQTAATVNTELQGKVTAFEAFKQARQVLTAKEAADLVPFLDAELFSLDSLEDAAVDTKVKTFRTLLNSYGKQQPAPALDTSGSTPPAISVSGEGVGNSDELFAWLNNPANAKSPDRAAKKEQFYRLVDK